MPALLPEMLVHDASGANGVKDKCTNIRDWQNIPYRVTKNEYLKRISMKFYPHSV